MAEDVRTIVDFDRRFARPYQLNLATVEDAIEGCPKILVDAYVTGVIDGMTGCHRPCPLVPDPAPASTAKED